jgi:hypothetical protein
MEQTDFPEMLEFTLQTPVNYPEESIQQIHTTTTRPITIPDLCLYHLLALNTQSRMPSAQTRVTYVNS